MNKSNPITSLPIHSLRPHPLLGWMPSIPQAIEETGALEASVRRDGVLQPILVDTLSQVLDGRRRLVAAGRAGLESVPVKIVEPGQEVAAILASLVVRRHLTKGQLAYTAFPLLEPAVEESRKRRHQNLRKGDDSPNVDSVDYRGTKTVEDFAQSLGFGRDLVFQAQALHRRIEKDPDLKPEIEEAVFILGHGLGAVIAGLAGKDATAGKNRPESRQLELFAQGWQTVGKRLAYWEKMDQKERRQARLVIEQTLSEVPPDLLGEIDRVIELKRRSAAHSL